MDQLCIDLFFHYGINFSYREGGTRLAVTYFCVYYIWSALDYFALRRNCFYLSHQRCSLNYRQRWGDDDCWLVVVQHESIRLSIPFSEEYVADLFPSLADCSAGHHKFGYSKSRYYIWQPFGNDSSMDRQGVVSSSCCVSDSSANLRFSTAQSQHLIYLISVVLYYVNEA